MVCVSDLFQDPHTGAAHVGLNERCDDRFQPGAIQNARDDRTYRGVRLEGPVYDVVAQCVDGMLCIPDDRRQTHKRMVAASIAKAAGPRAQASCHKAHVRIDPGRSAGCDGAAGRGVDAGPALKLGGAAACPARTATALYHSGKSPTALSGRLPE